MDDMIYGGRRPKGWVLAHNNVLRAVNTRTGDRGFRRFWISPSTEGWHLCQCGWRPDLGPHYARLPHSVACEDEAMCQEALQREDDKRDKNGAR